MQDVVTEGVAELAEQAAEEEFKPDEAEAGDFEAMALMVTVDNTLAPDDLAPKVRQRHKKSLEDAGDILEAVDEDIAAGLLLQQDFL